MTNLFLLLKTKTINLIQETNKFNKNNSNIPLQTHDTTKHKKFSNQKHGNRCDLVNKFALYREKGTKDKVKVSC